MFFGFKNLAERAAVGAFDLSAASIRDLGKSYNLLSSEGEKIPSENLSDFRVGDSAWRTVLCDKTVHA
jgi:hypothetical protein